jgi:hypothetical protein
MNTKIFAANGINRLGKNTATVIAASDAQDAIVQAKHHGLIAPMVEEIPANIGGLHRPLELILQIAEDTAERTLAGIERGQYLAAQEAKRYIHY